MNLFSHKKGLELPITAIVVLIISITFLGLVLFFIKTIFTGGTELLTEELAKIKAQLKENIETSGELFVMSGGTEIEVKKGEPKKFYLGVRNTAATDVCYRIAVRCLKPFTPNNYCSAGAQTTEPILIGGVEPDTNQQPAKEDNWFPRILSEMEIPGGDVEVSPVTLQIGGSVKPDTYLMVANIYKARDDQPCDTANNWPSKDDPYQSKRFHIIVT